MKKKITNALAALMLCGLGAIAQKPLEPTKGEKDQELKQALLAIRTTRQPLPDEQFTELVYSDFTKLLQAGTTTGKPLNFASVNLTKPKATVNYTVGPQTNKKWFINIGASGGFEDDIITLIENQKPAKSYSGNLSLSRMFFPKYFFGDENFALKDEISKAFPTTYVYAYETATVDYLVTAMANSSSLLDQAYTKLEEAIKKKQVDLSAEQNSINSELDNFNKLREEKLALEKSINERNEKLNKIYQAHPYKSKHLFWFTVSQKAGGSQFRFYDPISPEKTISNGKSNRSNYQTSLTGSYYYKNTTNNLRILFTLGIAMGGYNNFDELSGSEFKTVDKKEVTADTYTKTDVYTVYGPSDFKSYHATKSYAELYVLFSKNGNFGARGKYTFDDPYSEDKNNPAHRRAQQDAEIGLIFNTKSKAEEKKETTPISFELYYGFNDLNGSQPKATGKFYKRSEIGIKTAIPFSF